ncbi:MAG: hypothetical protein ACOQNV_03255 [Mycoplasmoidaceae bacterium]
MKKLNFLIPSLMTTVCMPSIGLVGCNKPETIIHKVKIDPSSDTSDITISTPEITLNQQLVIPYEVINTEKELDVDSSWLKFDSSEPQPLSDYSYADNKVIIPADKVTTYDITICLRSKQVAPPPEASDFNTDSWSTIGYYASRGLNSLTSAYSQWLSSHGNTFLGASRHINFNNQQYDVIVIGTEEDYYDVEHKKPIALTFQFTEILSKENGDLLGTNWATDGNEAQNYWTATLHDFLSNIVYPQIITENPELQDQIKSVDRVVNTKNNDVWTPTHGFEYIFEPLKGNLSTASDVEHHYSWWIQHQSQEDRIKKDKNGAEHFWWTTTIDNKGFVYSVTTTGAINGYGVSYQDFETHGVSPCFCI